MEKTTGNYSPAGFTILGIIFTGAGWGGLATLILYSLPTIGFRWLFFFLLFIAITGTFLPFTSFLNKRFTSNPPIEGEGVLRQAVWWGIYGDLLAWLQLDRLLTSDLALFIFFGFVALEFFLRIRETSGWTLKEKANG
jgi:hypothetical protein